MRRGLALGAAGAVLLVAAAQADVSEGVAELAAPESSAPKPLEVVVCESHHQVLRHWLRAAQGGVLPETGVTVVHFDAHPDLGVPAEPVEELAGSGRDDPAALIAGLDIATFQLAAVWLGLVDRIVWLRPAWATQLPDGERRFRLGLDQAGQLRVDDPSDYYVLDDGWAPGSSLRDPVEVELRVLSLSDAAQLETLASGPTVLDIDLDGFATRNPSADALRRAGLTDPDLRSIRTAFDPEHLDFSADPETRIAELGRLLAAVAAVAGEGLFERLGGAFTLWRFGIGPRQLWDLDRILARLPGDVSLELLMEEGRALVGLPERRADPEAIVAAAAMIRTLLRSGAVQPQLVTIARSVRDGYTPKQDWPAIEWQLLRALHAAVPQAKVRFDADLSPAPGPFPLGVHGSRAPQRP